LKNSQNWVPICLPGISSEGFLYAYVHYVNENLVFIQVSDNNSHDIFEQCMENEKNII